MALDFELFRLVVAPEYASKSNSEITYFSDEAELEIAVNKWGTFAPRAVALITAHLMKLGDLSKNGDSGSPEKQVKKVKTGDLSKEYFVGSIKKSKHGSYNLTSYGLEYIRLRKRILKTPLFVSC